MKQFLITLLLFLCPSLPSEVWSAEPMKESADSRGRSTAVALNYCRASFHRIRSNPSKRVLYEEREKILNNLNLNGIADEEVIRLYSAVLDEISQVQIAEKDCKFFKKKRNSDLMRQLGISTVLLGAQLGTLQYMSALRTGANSWWDYRGMTYQRDLNIWKLEKQQVAKVVSKSSQFLDTFWKLAQKKNIPDRWLIRGNDLDKLEEALNEQDPVVRLRVLKRMGHFLESYPPYLYYLARTQQQLGQLFAAAQTYNELADIGAGHFRKDDMLAAATANLAAIQEFLHQPDAARTASEALRYSTDVWEANLMAARVLEQHGMPDRAEDAILRNLDVDLEQSSSLVALLSLYHNSNQEEKLITRLNDSTLLPKVPIPILLQLATKLGPAKFPQPVLKHIARSMYAVQKTRFGPDDFSFATAAGWQAQNAVMTLNISGRQYSQPKLEREDEYLEVTFRGISEMRNPFSPSAKNTEIVLNLIYPGTPSIRVHVRKFPASTMNTIKNHTVGIFSRREQAGQIVIPAGALRISAIDVGNTRLSLLPVGSQQSVTTSSAPAKKVSPLPQTGVASPQKDVALPASKPTPKLGKPTDLPNVDPSSLAETSSKQPETAEPEVPRVENKSIKDDVPPPPAERPAKRSARRDR